VAQMGLIEDVRMQKAAPVSLPLKEHRVRSRVSLEEISDSTKISRRFLQAIEEGEYGILPGGVFMTSYIRQYAEAIGYDAEVILEHCRDWSGEPDQSGEMLVVKEPAGAKWMKFLLLG